MRKISKLSDVKIDKKDAFPIMDNKCNPINIPLDKIMDKYAIDFAIFIQDRDVYLEGITLDDLLTEFKQQYIVKPKI